MKGPMQWKGPKKVRCGMSEEDRNVSTEYEDDVSTESGDSATDW